MPVPVGAAPRDLPFEEQPRRVAAMRPGMEKQIHHEVGIGGPKRELPEKDDSIAALLQKNAVTVQRLQRGKASLRVAHDEPPHGTWLMKRMPFFTRIFPPGFKGTSR